MAVDPSRFPRVRAYLAPLPRALDSFPECVAKASIYRTFLENRPVLQLATEHLPEKLVTLVQTPLPPSAWVPEVRSMAVCLALFDHHRLTDAEAVRWMHDCNVAMMKSRMYRAITALASPSLLLRGASMRWRTFHHGSDIACEGEGNSAVITLRFPSFVFTEVLVRGFGESFKAIALLSRAR